jgi:hypothetical protein
MKENEAIEVLRAVKNQLGRNYKSAISRAWFNGNYEAEGLGNHSSALQNIRNIYGPKWLYNLGKIS